MNPRYGILVQTAQLLAQLFIDWCLARENPGEPFAFIVPGESVSNLQDNWTGVLVTISPVQKLDGKAPMSKIPVIQAIKDKLKPKRK